MRERLAQIGGQLETRREGALFLTHLTAACTLGEGEQDQDQDVTDA
ncbi:hypothetical protein H3H54_13025 [Brachybacterium sp. Z12]|nr:hypothetical protein [Brachybacterium sp. Z12]QNN82102.1 hypothetical protein H3H54_13025 [Brachybacterium sp. Z12]